MKKIWIILFTVIVFFTINVKAADTCESKEMARLKELAKKIEFDYDYNVVDGRADFVINAFNLNEDLRVLIIDDYYNDRYKEFKGKIQGTLTGFSSGEKVVITIKGFVPNPCSGLTVLTKTVRLPYYNIFYDEEKCKGNEDFKYCKLLLNTNISEGEFERQFEKYLKDKEAIVEPEEEVKESNNIELYLMIVGLVFIVTIIILLIVAIIKKRKKDRL